MAPSFPSPDFRLQPLSSAASWWANLRRAYASVFHRQVSEGASRQEKWEARFEGPLLVVSVVFLLLFAWSSLAHQGPWAQWITRVSFTLIWVVFAVDYAVRLVLAPQRWRWFWRHLPEFLLVVLPWFRPLQILRIVPTLLLLQRVSSTHRNITVAAYTIMGSVIMVVVAALAIYDVEGTAPESMITSFGDALWWSIVTVTTVGYGDIAPVTGFGRAIGVALMSGGIAMAGVLTATVSATLVRSVQSSSEQEQVQAREVSAVEFQRLAADNEQLRAQVEQLHVKLDAVLDRLGGQTQ